MLGFASCSMVPIAPSEMTTRSAIAATSCAARSVITAALVSIEAETPECAGVAEEAFTRPVYAD